MEVAAVFLQNNILLDTLYINNKLKNIHVAAASTKASRTFFKRDQIFHPLLRGSGLMSCGLHALGRCSRLTMFIYRIVVT